MTLVGELKRRNVFRVATAYLVVGWLLTEVLTTILTTLGAPDWTSRAVILVFALGFIPTVVLSWIYELTPDGIKRDHEIRRSGSVTQSKSFNYGVIATVVVLIVVIGVLGARPAGEPQSLVGGSVSQASVAVLPFVNMSNDDDNEYFSDGLTETLLHMLAQIPDLKVAARTSSFAFKGRNLNIQEIAAALKVAHVLEGSVQKAGKTIRVTAQLIRASDGFHVWSSSYDRTVDDIFAIQDEIAAKVGDALSESLLGAPHGKSLASIGTQNTDAYDLYLQACKERSTFSFGGLQAAENLLKGALVIDPDFVDAKTELADIFLHQAETGLINTAESFSQVSALATQVLEVDPDNVRANALALYATAADGSRRVDAEPLFAAIDELRNAVAAHPADYSLRILLTRLLLSLQRFDEALNIQLQALATDPFNARVYYELGSIYRHLERWDDARNALQRSLEIEAQQPNAYVQLAEVSLQTGDGLDFLQQMLKAMAVDPRDHELPGRIAAFLYNLELIEAGDDFRDRVVAIAPTSEIAYHVDLLRAIRTGDEDAGIASARRALEDDIPERDFSYVGAVQYLLRTAVERGTVAEETEWLDGVAPGILDIDAIGIPAKYRASQGVAFDAWYATLPRDELLNRIDKLLAIADKAGIDPLTKPQSRLAVLALRGRVDEARDLALSEVFSQSVVHNLMWRDSLHLAQYEEIISDSDVQLALQRWDEEWTAVRGRVSSYLADLSASS